MMDQEGFSRFGAGEGHTARDSSPSPRGEVVCLQCELSPCPGVVKRL